MKYVKLIYSSSEIVEQEYDVLYYNATDDVVALKPAKKTSGPSHVTPPPVIPVIETVDLGLPSGTKWMKCNIGAETETDYGKYFQWGDTVGYEGDEAAAHSTWATCPFNNGSSNYNSAYFTANSGTWLTNDAVLKPEYDAAYQATNGQAKMPTSADIEELLDNTNNEWTTVNGVNGYKFTNKSDSSKYIFIPDAGCAENGILELGGNALWCSNLVSSNYSYAYLWEASSTYQMLNSYNRCCGQSVRGVLNEN